MLFNSIQSLNASLSICLKLLGNSTLSGSSQPLNVQLFTLTVEFGISISVKLKNHVHLKIPTKVLFQPLTFPLLPPQLFTKLLITQIFLHVHNVILIISNPITFFIYFFYILACILST